MRAVHRVVLVWASRLTLVLAGWSILTRYQWRASYSTYIQFRDRNWFGLSGCRKWLGLSVLIELDFDFCVMMFDRKYMHCMESRQIDWCAGYVLEDDSVTVNLVAKWFVLNKRTKEVQAQIPVRDDWVALCFTRHKWTTEMRSSNPTEVVVQFFLNCIFLKFISTQQPGPKQNSLKNRSTS